ncbi:hypothetical protein [Aurantimicrobium minutum]|uniref:hypothetical protein n=1 Tax=Aurantimicrobium minutum TaxID=708131 RepID=UPI002476668E|nr:hypothetical protein [Aurantimicrobium minutum]MDH6240061.1 hypothetical protein [Aurantimicrobium minutum]
MSNETISIIFQSITLLAVFAAVWQLFLRSTAMHRGMEMAFVQRYWEIMDRRSPQLVIDCKPTPEDELIILQYLRLCEDEFDHRRLGKLPRQTWDTWRDAMRDQLADPHFADVLKKTAPHYPGVRQVMAGAADLDPHPRSRFVQFWQGN